MCARTVGLPPSRLGGRVRDRLGRGAQPGVPARRELYGAAVRHSLFALVPILFTALTAWSCIHGHIFAFDFHNAYWTAGHNVLAGASPYVSPGAPEAHNNTAFIYPAVAAVLLAPIALFPHALADGLFTALVIGAALGTLRVLEVRDWRLYGLVLLWPPVVVAWQNANVTLLLVLGTACLWRARDRPIAAGILAALLVSVKPFVWPLGIWLLATRRYAALAYTAAGGIALNAVAWLIVGPAELSRYADLLSAVTRTEERAGYGVAALALYLGSSHTVAYALTVVLAGAAGVGCLVLGRRGQDLRAMVLCVAAILLATPILWTHYFALLIVPLALARPRLSAAWLLPMAMLIAPETPPHMSQHLLVLLVGAAVTVLCLDLTGRCACVVDGSLGASVRRPVSQAANCASVGRAFTAIARRLATGAFSVCRIDHPASAVDSPARELLSLGARRGRGLGGGGEISDPRRPYAADGPAVWRQTRCRWPGKPTASHRLTTDGRSRPRPAPALGRRGGAGPCL